MKKNVLDQEIKVNKFLLQYSLTDFAILAYVCHRIIFVIISPIMSKRKNEKLSVSLAVNIDK